MWELMASVVPVVIGTHRAVTPKLGEWLEQILGRASVVSDQMSAVLGTATILHRTPKAPRLW